MLLNQTQFARLVGVSPQAVSFGVKTGRIKQSANGKIDTDSQVKAWRENSGAGGGGLMAAAKLYRMQCETALKILELRAARGEIVFKSDVESAVFKWSRGIRDELLCIPERVGDSLGSEIYGKLSADEKRHIREADLQNLVRGTFARVIRETLSGI